MVAVTVSPKFQVVIPKEIREKMSLKPGQKLQVLQFSDRIEFLPIVDARTMRGSLKGIKTDVPREGDRI